MWFCVLFSCDLCVLWRCKNKTTFCRLLRTGVDTRPFASMSAKIMCFQAMFCVYLNMVCSLGKDGKVFAPPVIYQFCTVWCFCLDYNGCCWSQNISAIRPLKHSSARPRRVCWRRLGGPGTETEWGVRRTSEEPVPGIPQGWPPYSWN